MTTPNDDYDDDQQEQEQQVPNWRRKLEADAKAEEEANAARRQLAMMQLGIDPTSGTGKLFAKAYDGEPTADAMRAAAEEFGVLAPVNTQQPDAAQQAMQRIQAASSGGVPSGGAAHDFEAELDSIPQIVNGQWNPDYQNAVLRATQAQAAREGAPFEVSGAQITRWANGSGPATTPIS